MASTGIAASDVDVWGNAMAAAIGFASMEQEASIFAFFSQFETNIFYEGQVGGSGARDTSYSFVVMSTWIAPGLAARATTCFDGRDQRFGTCGLPLAYPRPIQTGRTGTYLPAGAGNT